MEFSPSKANTAAVVLAITENSARADGVVHEDSTELLLGKLDLIMALMRKRTYRFSHVLRQV
jgi:hypothetical protein